MTLIVQIPAELEQQLRSQTLDLNVAALQAMLIEFYRQQKISRYQLSQALSLTRFETDELLKKHHVTEDLPTSEELEHDLHEARRLVQR
jgi:Uncharacterised protein family (UPF0175)